MSNTSHQNPFEKDEDSNSISELIHLYLPFWPVFLITVSISLFTAFMYIRYQTPIYQANATLILKDEESGTETILKALDVTATKKNVKNEIEILKSQKLMGQVVQDLGLYAQIYVPGRIHHLLAYTNSPVTFISLEPNKIKSSGGFIKFTYNPTDKSVLFEGKKYPLEVPVNTPYGKFRINYNHLNDQKTSSQFFLVLQTITNLAKGMVNNLQVNAASSQSTILNLSYTDPSPKRAEDILNTLIKTYNKDAINEKNTMSKNTLDFIEERLAKVTLELSNIEGEKVDYMTEKGIVDLSTEGSAYLSSVQNSDQQLSEIRIQMDVLNQIESYVANKNDGAGTVPATMGITDPVLSQVLNKLNEAELKLNTLRKTSAENAPSVIALKGQIAQLKPSLLENLRNFRQNLTSRQGKVQNESNKYTSKLLKMPKQERDLVDISRQQSIKNSIYTFLLQKREETALSYASAIADSRLVNDAESLGYPVSPVKTSLYFIALVVGFLVAILFVLMKEKFNKTIVFRSEIEKATRATILAEILHDESDQVPVITETNRSSIAEQFRSLRTSLTYLGMNGDKKTILFTSSISGDGKSFIAINMGASLALTDKKVVLLELDLRKPKLSKMLKIENEPGISNYLAGIVPLNKIIKPVEHVKNLFVLPSGAIPPNPTELMLNGNLDLMMEQLKKDFDFVIIDSPPIGLVTDAKILNKYADLSIYVIRHKHTPKKYLKFVNQLFVNREFNNLNLIFNGLKTRGVFGIGKSPTYGYGNGYGYGYGGYGEPESKVKNKKLFKKNIKA
ncbi:MAG: polysaccharide biosynthesis tyrosine autokinase [bacterium]|nr:polysaccharide biosynthesis tyrosine autokinase [bacterium]